MKTCKNGHASKRGKDGYCLECRRGINQRYRAKYPEKRKADDKRRYAKNPQIAKDRDRRRRDKNPKNVALRQAKKRAALSGYPYAITEDDVNVPEFCPLLGIKISRGVGKLSDASPSLDKIRPELGYVPGNVWIISNRANRIKSDATVQELELLVANLKRHLEKFPWE